MSKLTRYTLLGLLPLLFPAMVAAAEQHDPLKKSLPPEQVQQIQTISQAVLTAKRDQPSSPDMANLRQRMDELRQAVVKLHGVSLHTGKVTALPLQNSQAVTPDIKLQQEEQERISMRAEAEKGVRQALERVRSQRTFVQQKVAQSPAGEDHSLEQSATTKVQQLEDELDKALQSPPEKRAASLQAIKERLIIKPRSLKVANEKKTPTFTTIVHHRE